MPRTTSMRTDMMIPSSEVELLIGCSKFREDKGVQMDRRRSVGFRPDKRQDEGRPIQSNHRARCLLTGFVSCYMHGCLISLRCSLLLANRKHTIGQRENSNRVGATWCLTWELTLFSHIHAHLRHTLTLLSMNLRLFPGTPPTTLRKMSNRSSI